MKSILSLLYLVQSKQSHTSNLQGHHWHVGVNPGMALHMSGSDIDIIRKYCTYFLPPIMSQMGERPDFTVFRIPDPIGDPLGIGMNLKLSTDIAWEDIEYKITDIEPE